MTGQKIAVLLMIIASLLGFVAFGLGYFRNGEFRALPLVFGFIFGVFAISRRRQLMS